MKKTVLLMKKTVLFLMSVLCFQSFVLGASGNLDWKNITVEVVADQAVAVEQRIKSGQDGFFHLEVFLSNEGTSPLSIGSVEVTIPFLSPLPGSTEVLYGSTCMGQRPLSRTTISNSGPRTYSYMYNLLRLPTDQYLLMGSLSWRIFMPVMSSSESGFRIMTDGEGRQVQPGETIAYEKIAFKRSPNWVDLLQEFGQAIAAENGIESVKDVEFTGWATWDYYGRLFQTEDVLTNMARVDELYPAKHLIQIDGGWWSERGDYLSVRDDLPGGIKAISEAIVAAGNIPGLHFDGFRADLESDIYREHPEYFLHDVYGNVIVDPESRYDRDMHHIFFDFSHPGAREYIAECIRVMKEEWGITYFKIDFLRYGLESEIKRKFDRRGLELNEIVAYDPTITGIERFRLGLQTMQDAIGDENYFLGCSAVFAPAIGFVDGMRTGGDIHPTFDAFRDRTLANSGNFYLDGTVFRADVDYLVFREGEDEDDRVSRDPHKYDNVTPMNEVRMWSDYNKLFGNIRLASDNLNLLRPERKALIREAFEWPAADESVPLDIWKRASDRTDGFEWILSRSGDEIYLGLFNWGDEPKEYDVTHFGISQPVVLEPRHSTILIYQGQDSFRELAAKLQSR